ncbi:MAG TPA: alpha/beta hydrolase [Gaiella sp.]|jgi:pimeloyl-ACP methyl ester carboxylesterase
MGDRAPRIHTVDALGDPLAVRDWGPEEGVPILFWHSLGPASSAAFAGVAAPALGERGFRLVAPDAPGFGRSPGLAADEYAVTRLVERLLAVRDALALVRPVLMGHSWGGVVACHAAAARPQECRALVLLDSGHVDYADWPGADMSKSLEELVAESEASRVRAGGLDELRAEVERDVSTEPWIWEAFREGLRVEPDGSVVGVTTGSVRGAAMYWLVRAHPSETWSELEAAELPALLLLATEPDDLRERNARAAERFLAGYPSAEVVALEGCGHSVFTDLGGRLGELVGDWLRLHARP